MTNGYSILYFSGIHVIESLRDEDSKTGQILYRDFLRHQPHRYDGLRVSCATVNNKEEFEKALAEVRDMAFYANHNPILHIEAHGSKEGLQLSSGEMLNWHWLQSILTEINVVTNMNLMVTLAACHGAYLMSLASPINRAPFWMLLAPFEEVNEWGVEVSFAAFYQELLHSFDVRKAMDRMISENDGLPFNYGFSNVRQAFIQGWETYRRDQFRDEKLKEREERFIQMARSSRTPAKYFLDSDLRKIFRSHIDNEQARKKRFERLKRSFFLCDLYPGNYVRFGLSEINGEV
jgi:hypothetical protein